MPKISILMGMYNNEDTVANSIESIISQTYSDWELIICDDASSDQSVEIVKEYMQKDARIVLLENEHNGGLSYALNRCLEVAKGEFCARMDGDDVCDSTRLEKQLNFLQDHTEYGFVSTTMKRFDENGVYHIPETKEGYSPQNKDFIKGSPFCHAPVMMRTEAYKAVGCYRDLPMTRGVEDYDLWFRLYAEGIKGFVLQEPLYSMFDGRQAAKRRTFKRRVNEFKVRVNGYKILKIPFIFRIYAFKPIILGLIPQKIYIFLRELH